jgi:peptidoglycan/xylan/chitin deacetylase (PgdA/CDA1 family)
MNRQKSARRPWQWPQDAKIVVSVGLAFEAFDERSQFATSVAAGQVNHFSRSYGDYGWKAGAWRLIDLLEGYDIRGQVYTNGRAAAEHPEVVAAYAASGHEIVGHGWVNDRPFGTSDPDAVRAEIRRCTEVLAEAAGTRPRGWLSPGYTGTAESNAILASEGYAWAGDDASDDLPFIEETAGGAIVVIPTPGFTTNDLSNWLAPRNPPGIIWDGFKDTFDQLYREGRDGSSKWIEIVLHSHVAGRPTLIPTVRRCLDYAIWHDEVVFMRRCEIADWAVAQHERTQK